MERETPQEAAERLTANLVVTGWPREAAEIITRRASETAGGLLQAALIAATIAGELADDDLRSTEYPLTVAQCRAATLSLLIGRLNDELIGMSDTLKAAGAIMREPIFKVGE